MTNTFTRTPSRTIRPGTHRQASPAARASANAVDRQGRPHPTPDTPSWEELLGRR